MYSSMFDSPIFLTFCWWMTWYVFRETLDLDRIVCAFLPMLLPWSDSFLGPFCQNFTERDPLHQDVLDPPPYSSLPTPARVTQPPEEEPPSYFSLKNSKASLGNPILPSKTDTEDVLHFIDPSKDSLSSLSLRYGVSQNELRRKNGLFADHLLVARQTIVIPGEFYKGGVSLSPVPVGGEEEEVRKSKIRRWMVACKVSRCVGNSYSYFSIWLYGKLTLTLSIHSLILDTIWHCSI